MVYETFYDCTLSEVCFKVIGKNRQIRLVTKLSYYFPAASAGVLIWCYTSNTYFQWDLVCDKTALVATAQSFLMVGKFVGVLTSGLFSDR